MQIGLAEAWHRVLLKFVLRTIVARADSARGGNDWLAAARAYRWALRLAPGHAAVWVQYGHALKEAGALEAGINAYRRAIAHAADATNDDAPIHLAHLLLRQGRQGEAFEVLEASRFSGAAFASAWLACGNALEETNDMPRAEAAYRAAIERDRSLVLPRLALARLLARAKRLVAAQSVFEATLRLERLDAAARIERAGTAALMVTLLIDAGRALDASRLAERAAAAILRDGAVTETDRAILAGASGRGAIALEAVRRILDEPAGSAPAPLLVAAELLEGRVKAAPQDAWARAALRAVRAGRHGLLRRRAARRHGARADRLPAAIPFLAIGTTGLCNASCLHCPTGKPATALSPRHPMPMAMYERIFRDIAALNITLSGAVNHGLFGDGLTDPLVVPRIERARALAPDAMLVVTTNAAAYSRARHRALADTISRIAVHIESLVPDSYNRLMQPLRLDRVLPRIDQLLEDFPGKVMVTVPVSRANRHECPDMERFFRARGAIEVQFDNLSNRCTRDNPVFEELAHEPTPGRCGPDLLDTLVVDCDGTVLICCNDFSRAEPIGNLATEPLFDVLTNDARQHVRDQFVARRHADRTTCAACAFSSAVPIGRGPVAGRLTPTLSA